MDDDDNVMEVVEHNPTPRTGHKRINPDKWCVYVATLERVLPTKWSSGTMMT